MTQIYGELDPLYDTVRTRVPDVIAVRVGPSAVSDTGTPGLHMRVSYRHAGPRHVVWDDALEAYRWDSGPDAGEQLGREVDRAAEGIARALGAPVIPDRK